MCKRKIIERSKGPVRRPNARLSKSRDLVDRGGTTRINTGQPCFMVLIPYNSSMSLANVDIYSFLSPNSATVYTDAFFVSLADRILETWSEFESSAIVPFIQGVQSQGNYPPSAGDAYGISVTIPIGGLVCPKQFTNITDMALPSNHYERTEHMDHMLASLDRAFLLTLLRWWGEFSLPTKTITLGPQAQNWIQGTVPIPGLVNTPLQKEVLYLSDGVSLDAGFAQAFKDNFFNTDISLFPTSTDYFSLFIDDIAQGMQQAVLKWKEDTYIHGGVCAGVIIPPGVFVPTIVAQKLST